MNYFHRVPIPITFISAEKVKEVFIRTYPDNEMHLLQDSYSIEKSKNEKCTLIWLNPGKCLYQFIINNIKHLNFKNAIEKVNDDYFNVLLITKESSGLEIKVNSTELKSNIKRLIGNERDKSLSIEDYNYLTLSIKGENTIQEVSDAKGRLVNIMSLNDNNVHDNDLNDQLQEGVVFDKVIVYNYNNNHLIEMFMTPYESDNPDLICLKYDNTSDAETIVINKNEVFYQSIKSFDKVTDISKLSTINELAIIKTMHQSFLNKKNYIIVNDIMVAFYSSNNNTHNIDQIVPSSNMINLFMSIGENSLIIIKGKEIDELAEIIKEANHSISDALLLNIFALSKLMKESTILHIIIKDNSEIEFNLLPFINQNSSLYNHRNIILNKDYNQTQLVKISLEASKEIHKISFNEEDEDVFLEFCNYNARVINIIYNITSKANLGYLFKDFFRAFLICYLVLTHYRTYNEDSNDYIPEHNANENLMVYYSNIMALTIVRTLLQLVSVQSKREDNYSQSNRKQKDNWVGNKAFLVVYCNNDFQDKEYARFLNDIIYRRHLSTQSMNKNNSDLISNILLKLYNESVIGWKSQISTYFINEILSRYDLMFTSVQLYKTIQTQSQFKDSKLKLIDVWTINISKGFILLQNSELSNSKLKQFIYVSLNSSFNSFLFTSIEQIIAFIHYNKLIQYANDNINQYFCYLPLKEFNRTFLPLLIDNSTLTPTPQSNNSNAKINTQNRIMHFIIDLQTLQRINEKFEVNLDGVYFGFQTFETMITLIQNLKHDKALFIQSYFRRYIIEQIINRMRLSAIILQNKWRNYFYKSITNTPPINTNDIIPLYLINKYKTKDAILLKYLLGIKKMTNGLEKDNIKLKQKYTIFNCKQSTNFNFRCELTKRRHDSKTKNMNSSSSSSVYDNSSNNNMTTAKGNNNNTHTHTKSFFSTSNILTHVKPEIKRTNTNTNQDNKDIDKHLTTDLHQENSEIKVLNEKIEESKRKYRDMVLLASEYEKKVDGLIALINSKEEVREILRKNGVQFN